MNKTVLAGIAAGVLVLGLIIAPLSWEHFAEGERVKRVVVSTTVESMVDPGIGHETHQIAILLPPMDNVVYSGRFSWTSSAPVEVVLLHDIKPGDAAPLKYTIDGEKEWALTLIFPGGDMQGATSGSMSFAGAALALHTLDGTPFTATVTIHAQARAVEGELPIITPVDPPRPMVKTITVSEWQPWFQPSALQVDPGTPIAWDAHETASIHTITFVTRVVDLDLNMDPDFTVKTITLLAPGDVSPVWTPEAGVYVYVCAIHPYMTGVISAGVPYNAITGETGPAGVNPTVTKFAPWMASVAPWPDNRPFMDPPVTPGVGEVWVDTQFEVVKDPDSIGGKFGNPWPGSVTVVDASTWQVTDKIWRGLNGPHNLDVSPDGRYIIQTNWHANYITLIDAQTKEVLKNYIETGFDPAHVQWTEDNQIIVSINAGAELQIFDGAQVTDLDISAEDTKPIDRIRASVTLAGPHGIWYRDRMVSVPYHLQNHAVVVDVDERAELFAPINLSELEDDIAGGTIGAAIDLASYMGPEINGNRFWVTSIVLLEHDRLLQGRLVLYNIGSAVGGPSNPQFVKMLEVGSIPIQTPVSPDGRYVVTANSGGLGVPGKIYVTQLDYNNPANSRNVAILDSYPGSHGVAYGFKQGGGLYAYVTNKFAPVLQVVDLTTSPPSLAGEVDLGNGWGGMGVVAVPSAGYYATLEQHPQGRLFM